MDQSFSFKSRNGLTASIDTTDWSDFKTQTFRFLQAASGGERIFDRFLFRGQSCSAWLLESSFDRKHKDLAHVDKDTRYRSVMSVFSKALRIYGEEDATLFDRQFRQFGPEAAEASEMLAQHFGLPSRLLDWTKSIYVASFFAFSRIELCETGLVSVWVLDKTSAQKALSENHVSFHESVYRENKRALWQMGAFTRNKTDRTDFAELFAAGSPYAKILTSAHLPLLVRFDLPVSSIKEALDDLDMMRVNSLTLFPGIEGVVRWIERGGYALREHY